MLWTHASVVAPPLPTTLWSTFPCPAHSIFNVAATKYFTAWPMRCSVDFLFSGTVFYADGEENLQVRQFLGIKSAFPPAVKCLARNEDIYYPNGAWLVCAAMSSNDYQYKVEHGIPPGSKRWRAASRA